jgi:hypothetical protein
LAEPQSTRWTALRLDRWMWNTTAAGQPPLRECIMLQERIIQPECIIQGR